MVDGRCAGVCIKVTPTPSQRVGVTFVTQSPNSGLSTCYLRIPKSAPQSWFTSTVPSSGPGRKVGGLELAKPVMLVTTSCGRGLSVGTDSFGEVRTDGWGALVVA